MKAKRSPRRQRGSLGRQGRHQPGGSGRAAQQTDPRVQPPLHSWNSPPRTRLGEIIKSLEAGQHVVLSFGKNESDLDYLLVTNLLTRRIREAWEKKTNAFRTSPAKPANRVRW